MEAPVASTRWKSTAQSSASNGCLRILPMIMWKPATLQRIGMYGKGQENRFFLP
jgi:hypothetical protein